MQPPLQGFLPGPTARADASATAGTVVGILLAAGHGARFDAGGQRHKLLEPYPPGQPGALPLALVAARKLRAAGPVLVVLRAVAPKEQEESDGAARRATHQRRLHELLAGAGCQVVSYANADEAAAQGGKEGTGASIACAVRASADAAGWIVALADMPAIEPATIAAVRQALLDGATTVAPYYRGKRGHPVGFSAMCGPALAALAGDAGARAVLERHPPLRIDVEDPGILFDVDRVEDLQVGPGSGLGASSAESPP